ncbi:MAG: hypothetical protein IPL92_06415 [Saprospiraceae bacterium]|nr:hypothetical protein [Candidatus Opimibacter iunctus]
MKNLFLLLITTFTFSCTNSSELNSESQFSGYGELIIGNQIDSIRSFSLFKEVSENEYSIDKYELTKEIGVVEEVGVKTKDGVIYEVKFDIGKYTNKSVLDSQLQKLRKEGISRRLNKNSDNLEILFYKTSDDRIELTRMTFKDSRLLALNGYFSASYRYYDKRINDEINSMNKAIQDSIEKAIYMKDVKGVN